MLQKSVVFICGDYLVFVTEIIFGDIQKSHLLLLREPRELPTSGLAYKNMSSPHHYIGIGTGPEKSRISSGSASVINQMYTTVTSQTNCFWQNQCHFLESLEIQSQT